MSLTYALSNISLFHISVISVYTHFSAMNCFLIILASQWFFFWNAMPHYLVFNILSLDISTVWAFCILWSFSLIFSNMLELLIKFKITHKYCWKYTRNVDFYFFVFPLWIPIFSSWLQLDLNNFPLILQATHVCLKCSYRTSISVCLHLSLRLMTLHYLGLKQGLTTKM